MKRGSVSQQALALKKQRLADDVVMMEQLEEREKEDDALGELMELVIGDPKLIRAAIKHVKCLKAGKPSSGDDFPSTYIYVWKVPKEWTISMLNELRSDFWSDDVISKMSSQDRRFDQKLLYFCAGIDSRQKIMHHNKAKFLELIKTRHDDLHRPLDCIKVDEAGINWQACGYFELLPPFKQDGKKTQEKHIYKHVRCKALPGDNNTVDLPDAYNVTAAWTLNKNWCFEASVDAPATSKTRTNILMLDLFADLPDFESLVAPLPAYGKRDERKGRKAAARSATKQKSAGAAKEETEADRRKGILKSALARLKKRM